jgi:hypothetical protein
VAPKPSICNALIKVPCATSACYGAPGMSRPSGSVWITVCVTLSTTSLGHLTLSKSHLDATQVWRTSCVLSAWFIHRFQHLTLPARISLDGSNGMGVALGHGPCTATLPSVATFDVSVTFVFAVRSSSVSLNVATRRAASTRMWNGQACLNCCITTGFLVAPSTTCDARPMWFVTVALNQKHIQNVVLTTGW